MGITQNIYQNMSVKLLRTDLKKLGSPIFFVSCNASTLPREADISETCMFVQIWQNHSFIWDLCVILEIGLYLYFQTEEK